MKKMILVAIAVLIVTSATLITLVAAGVLPVWTLVLLLK